VGRSEPAVPGGPFRAQWPEADSPAVRYPRAPVGYYPRARQPAPPRAPIGDGAAKGRHWTPA